MKIGSMNNMIGHTPNTKESHKKIIHLLKYIFLQENLNAAVGIMVYLEKYQYRRKNNTEGDGWKAQSV